MRDLVIDLFLKDTTRWVTYALSLARCSAARCSR